ncbi:MAG TPA: hypothetical protein VJS64_12800, partial [Pyrinomonadaceae bacterium]|nr:hypothetical protein [Pyrinomonadaceae bacterium]
PNFAMAYARLGVFYGNQTQLGLAQEYVQKAYDLRDRVSERERLYISEKYYNYITGENDKAVETLQAWTKLYPNDYIPHNNLALNYLYFGRYEDARREATEAVRLSPTNISARDNLLGSFLGLNRLDEAEQVGNEMARLFPDSVNSHFNKFMFAVLRGDQSQMDAEVQWARGKSAEADLTDQLAGIAMSLGQFKKGEDLKRRAVELYKNQGRTENASQALLGLADRQSLVGKCEQAKENATTALGMFRGRVGLPSAAMVFATCNDQNRAQSLLDEALRLYPKDTFIVLMLAPQIRAQLERGRGNGAKALEVLESVRGYDFGLISGSTNNYLRGQVYLEQRSGKDAAVEFQKILEYIGNEIYSLRKLAHLGLARAAAIDGDSARSRKAYQDFFGAWKDADADLPIMIAARKEYEQLK